LLRAEAQLDVLFPDPASTVARGPTPVDEHAPLPKIPGYRVDSLIGRGGMGVVYRAHHLSLNRAVAIKMLLGGAHAQPHERLRFAREAEAVAGLGHSHIVQVHDYG